MATVNVSKSVTLGGRAYSGPTPSADFGVTTNVEEITLNAAKTGTLTTRTDNDTGVITLTAGHGLSSGKIDIFWAEGGVKGSRVNMDGTISTNALTIDGGTGDNLPTNNTAVTAVVPSTETVTVNADNLAVIAATINSDSHCCIAAGTLAGGTGAFSVGARIELNDGANGRTFIWNSVTDGTNPLDAANTFTTLKLSQGSTAASNKLKLSFAGE
jgi:hypothetical protein